MESVLIDQSPVNPRKGVVVNSSSSNGGFMTRSHKSFSSTSSSYSSVNRLFHNLNAGTGGSTASFGLFGSHPPPPRHSSLPFFSAAPSVVAPPRPFPPPPLHQAPLLPLPFCKSATLPSPAPTKRIAAAAAVSTVRSREHRKKTRPVANPPRKEARTPATTPTPSDPLKGESVSVVTQKPAQKPTAPPEAVEWEGEVEEGEEEREEGFSMESVYLLSPPPSSLPLPTFFLKRPKAAASAASCIAEAMGCGGGGGGGSNCGASDDLRRLLRL